MAKPRKLGKPSDQRRALLRNQVSSLLWHGKIVTTEARAKEVRRIAEKLITLAVNEYDKSIKVKKEVNNEKGQTVTIEVTNDTPSKLHARRKMMAYLYDLRQPKKPEETKKEYKQRNREVKHPLIEKLFNDYGPKYRSRNQEKNCVGGYTRIVKLGPRRGDGAEQVLIELVD
jgi:large subunit ribosomal protein L17